MAAIGVYTTPMEYDVEVQCPYCFESFYIGADISGGEEQQITQDCDVCCRPIEIQLLWQESEQTFVAECSRGA